MSSSAPPPPLPEMLASARQLAKAQRPADAMAAYERLLAAHPGHEMLVVELAVLRAQWDDLPGAQRVLQGHLDRQPQSPMAWLLLGQILDDNGDGQAALMARFEAISRAQAAGLWLSPSATPPHMLQAVAQAVQAVRRGRREIFSGVLEGLRRSYGGGALKRVDRALTGYLGDWDATPPDPMQRPRFFYFPDLPTGAFMDPDLQPWAARLREAYPVIRAEALSLVDEGRPLEDFVPIREGDRIGNYLGGPQPAWEAFFFYRHGTRYDDNHVRCPRTSEVLESLDLARIPGQTPEICFSVLAPHTEILAHHGVSNIRAVMHLPLIVPDGCALNLPGHGTHAWREGELMMFDDTFLHEAWNRSDSARIILLMDCWNPDLTPVEREATSLISRTIGALDVALKPDAWGAA